MARWLNTLGVTGIVLKYRVPAPEGQPRFGPALQDAQRALSLIRAHAKEWEIDPDRIGMMGFSAGGHLTAAAATNSDKRTYEPIDEIDKTSCRPDFGVVIYPGGIVKKGTDQLSPEIRVSAQTPPLFIVQADNDPVNPENAAYLYLAMKHAGASAELHIFATGGHGFGMRPTGKGETPWTTLCAQWMETRGILKNGERK